VIYGTIVIIVVLYFPAGISGAIGRAYSGLSRGGIAPLEKNTP
jgi:hypothetical protein